MLSEKNGESGDMQMGKYKINATNQKMLGLKNIVITIDEEYNFDIEEANIDIDFSIEFIHSAEG